MISCKEITNLLADYLEGSLDPETLQALKGHLEGCRTCENFMRSYETTTTLLRDLGEEEVPGELKARVLRFLRQRPGRTEESS
ncbi:MAG: anti-sigma factor family protein [Candidatus Methylomirabilales bacterium]